MDNEVLQNIWGHLSENDLTDSEFEVWSENFLNDSEVQTNVHDYLFANQLTDSNFDDWLTNLGLKKKDELDQSMALQLADGGLELSETKALTTLNRNRRPTASFQSEKDTAIERMFGKNEVTDFFGDLYRAGVQGQAQGATVDDALNLFAQGQDISDEDLVEYINEVKTLQSQAPSEEMQDFSRIYEQEGKGVYGFLKGVFKNPTVIPQLFTSSVSAMVNKGSVAAGLAGAGIGATVGALPGALIGGIAGMSGALETGLAYTEFLEEELSKKGLAFDEEGIRKVLEDEEAMISIQNRALGRGISIAAIDAMSGGLAVGVTRRAALKSTKGLAAAAGLGIEAVGGGVGEIVARGIAGQEMDVAEIGFEAVAGTATAPLTVGAGLLKPASYKLNGGNATRKQVQDLVNKGTPDEIAGAQITIKNDPKLLRAAQNKESDAILIAKIKEVNPGINEEDEAALLGLEKKRQTLESSSLKSAKNNLAIVDEQIDEISKKYQGTKETIAPTEEEVRESLAAKGIENPTQKQIREESDLITNKKLKDADKIESPIKILDEKQSEDGKTVVEGDDQSTKSSRKITQTQKKDKDKSGKKDKVEVEETAEEVVELGKEVQVEQEVDQKGRKITKFATTTEKDGIRTTKFEFNRSDKGDSQRNRTHVDPETAFGQKYEVNPEDQQEGYTVTKVSEVREGESGASADVRFTDKDGESFDGSVRLKQKKKTGGEVTEVTKEKDGVVTTNFEKIIKGKKRGNSLAPISVLDNYELDLEANDIEGLEIIGVREIRKKDGKTAATITVKDGNEQFETQVILQDKEAIAEEDVIKVEKTTQPTEEIREIFLGNNKVKLKKGKIISILDKSNKEVSPSVVRKVEKKLIDEGIVDIDGTILEQQEIPLTRTQEFIIENSKSPRQIAETIKSLQKERQQTKQTLKEIKSTGLPSLFGTKFSPTSLQRLTGFTNLAKNLGRGFVRTWVKKDGINIEDGFTDPNEIVFEPDEILDFITTYPTEASFNSVLKQESELIVDAKIKFSQLTGLKPSPTNINAAIKAPSQYQQVFEAEMRAKERLERQRIEKEVQKRLPKEKTPEEKAAKPLAVRQQKKKARRARENIKAGKMGPQPSTTLLTQLFTLDPSIIPNEQKQAYTELLNEVGGRAEVLTLSEEQVIMPKAQQILNAVEAQVDVDDGAKTPKAEVDFDVITESKRIAKIKSTIDPALDQDSKKLAKEINSLTAEDIEGLVKINKDGTKNVSQIKQLEKVKDNITKGYVPKKASELMIQVRSNKNADVLLKPFTNLKRTKILTNYRKVMFEIEKWISQPFGGISAKNWISNRIRNNPLFQIDDILGNFNSKTIYINTFRKLSQAFSTNETETKQLQAKIDAAYNLIAKDKSPIERPHNDIVKDQYKLRLYQLQREHLSNPGNKKAPSAIDFLNITIDAALAGDVLNANDLKILQDLKKEFEVDGEIDNVKIEKSFTKNQKEALKLLDEVNNSLAPKALFTSATIRGNKIDLLNDYSHHVILRDYNSSKEYFQQQQGGFVNPSPKAGPLFERTAGEKPISFDPFLSATRGVQETLLAYHLTVPIRELQQTLNKLETKIKENPNTTNEDIMGIKALRAAVNESLENVFQSTFTDYKSTLLNKMRILGYQAALASAPRAVAEFTSNFSFALLSNPEGFMDGVSKYMAIIQNHELGINFMNNVGSTETNKLYNADELTGKYADIGLFKQVSSKKGQAKSQVNNIANYIAGFGGKQLAQFVNKLANNVLSAPDQWISRPLFMGEFAKTFKAETGITLTSDDMKSIAEGDSKYLGDEYKDAIEKAVISADRQSIQMATSRNPFNTIPKLQQKPGQSLKNAWRIANGYMANFSLFEFTTARSAINALFNAGEISSQQAVGLLAGVTMRMTLYMVIYQVIIGQMDEAFGAPEDEDTDELDEIGYLTARQLTGAMTSLLTRGTLGNIPNIPITMGIEAFNEKYLQSLREDEEYDPFKHALVFSAIGKKELREKDLYSLGIESFAGPYGPFLKTASRTKKVASRALYNKTKKGRQSAKDELTERLAYEALGNLGLMPFYKDVRRIINKKFFEDKKAKNKTGFYNKSELRKINPKLYKQLYGPNSPEARRKKIEAEIKKKRRLKR